MCKTVHQGVADLPNQLATVLQGTVKLSAFYPSSSPFCSIKRASPSQVITQCCIHELYLQGKTVQSVVDLAKGFERRKCNHREAISGDACLKDVIGNFVIPASLRKLSLNLSRRNEQTPLCRCHTIPASTLVTAWHPCRTHCSYQSFGDDSGTTQ